MEMISGYWNGLPEALQQTMLITLKIVAILIPLILTVAYLTFAERKIIGYMQNRIGPNRVGPKGLLQRCPEVVGERNCRTDPGEQVPVHHRSDSVDCPGVRDLGGDPGQPRVCSGGH